MSLLVDIRKDFGSFCLDVHFESEGGVTGLLGASGCGKTMTLRCIAGIVKPDEGRIVLDGITLFDSERHINLPPQKRRTGYLFQSYGLFPNMTVEQNILCGLKREKDRKVRAQAVKDMVERMMLGGLEKRKPWQLSGGQQQRVALARILVGRPRILLLDEPFSALDVNLRMRMQTEMKQMLSEFEGDVLLVTHDRTDAYLLCSNVAVMDDGRLLKQDRTENVFRDPGSAAAAQLIGCRNIAPAERTGDHGVRVPCWGVEFTTATEVGEELRAVGVMSHSFRAAGEASVNAAEAVFVDEIDEPFEKNLRFRFRGADKDSEPLWWKVPDGLSPETFPSKVGIAPEDILLLY